ncbi:MAG: hypothetical protein J6K57_07030 [Alistipes sp.]|nr:hypothetical protein [Alistipes sp.]
MKTHCEKFTLGRMGTVTSILLSALLVYGAIAVWSAGMTAVIVTYIIYALLAVWVLLTMPRYLIIQNGLLIITHPIGRTVIEKSQVVKIEAIERSDLRGSLRLFGSGGFFGWFGIFRNSKFGTYRLYCGQLENLYLVKTTTKKYIISSSVPIEL